jgi:hypothetical protein
MDRWLEATARPVPQYAPPVTRRRQPLRAVGVVALAGIVVIAGLGAVVVGGFLKPTQDARQLPAAQSPSEVPSQSPADLANQSPAELAATATRAIASAPGVRYTLAVAVDFGNETQHLDSSGEIDLQRHRFSGIADGGGGTMVLFGGPSSGAVVIADGLFVRTGAGAWEHIADPSSPLDRLTDPDGLSGAIAHWIAASRVDPTSRSAPCGAQRCQIVRLAVPAPALSGLLEYVFGSGATSLPNDIAPISVDLDVDASGFPGRMETKVTAGTTTTTISLQVTRLDPAPTITPPIP